MEKRINNCILSNLYNAAQLGHSKAYEIAQVWRNSLKWMTYQAVCRREGRFIGKSGSYDFNEDLVTAFMNELDTDWNRVFNHEIRLDFETAGAECESHINALTNSSLLYLEDEDLSEFQKTMFSDQCKRFSYSLWCILRDTDRWYNSEQREVSRIPKATIQKYMKTTYAECLAQRIIKPGTLLDLMHEAMLQGIQTNGTMIFSEIEAEIRNRVRKITTDGSRKALQYLEQSCNSFVEDCKHIFSGKSLELTSPVGKDQERIVIKLRVGGDTLKAARYTGVAVIPGGENETKNEIEAQQRTVDSPYKNKGFDLLYQSVSPVIKQEDSGEDSDEDGDKESDEDGSEDDSDNSSENIG